MKLNGALSGARRKNEVGNVVIGAKAHHPDVTAKRAVKRTLKHMSQKSLAPLRSTSTAEDHGPAPTLKLNVAQAKERDLTAEVLDPRPNLSAAGNATQALLHPTPQLLTEGATEITGSIWASLFTGARKHVVGNIQT